jgi:hypothetical protein
VFDITLQGAYFHGMALVVQSRPGGEPPQDNSELPALETATG